MNIFIRNYVRRQSLSTVVVEFKLPVATTTTKNGCRFVENIISSTNGFFIRSYAIIYCLLHFYCSSGTVPSSQQQQQQQQHPLVGLVSLVVVAMADAVAASKRREIEQKAISTPKRSKILFRVACAVAQQNAGFAQFLGSEFLEESSIVNSGSHDGPVMIDPRSLPRGERKVYNHERAEQILKEHYLSPTPLFDGREFDTMFRISRRRFQALMEDIAATEDQFYLSNVDAFGRRGACFEAKLLLPLKTMAYGVAPHTFRDYFEMSTPLTRKCCKHFDQTIRKIYTAEYLRCPDSVDIKRINKLHKEIHGVDGMFGSLDCMHTYWKNCPTAWQGSYKGKEGRPSIVLEAIGDYHMWFWHAAYGYAGCMNDKSILAISPFFEKLIDGSFAELESEVVPYTIGEYVINQMFILVDGIYPQYSRLVKGYAMPITDPEKEFTKWQESARKDIERAFALLKGKWQCMERPFRHIDLPNISARVACCLILHNMCVSDRVMDGDVRARYDPSNKVVRGSSKIRYPRDLLEVQGPTLDNERSVVGLKNLGGSAGNLVSRKNRWEFLKNKDVTVELHKALMSRFIGDTNI
jgi:Plant transposon protein